MSTTTTTQPATTSADVTWWVANYPQFVASDTVMVRRDALRPGDHIVSSHYGRAVVTAATTTGITTALTFEGITGRHRGERYDAASMVPLLARALPTWDDFLAQDAAEARTTPAEYAAVTNVLRLTVAYLDTEGPAWEALAAKRDARRALTPAALAEYRALRTASITDTADADDAAEVTYLRELIVRRDDEARADVCAAALDLFRADCDEDDEDAPEDHGPAVAYACAECGTTTASSYVVTILDEDDDETRTEVCLRCHTALTAGSAVAADLAALPVLREELDALRAELAEARRDRDSYAAEVEVVHAALSQAKAVSRAELARVEAQRDAADTARAAVTMQLDAIRELLA